MRDDPSSLPPEAFTFQADRFDQGRLLWHASVHDREYEFCSYFIMKMRDTRRASSRDRVLDALDRTGIRSYCLYGLFGHYDFLLRTWSRVEWRSRLVEEFDSIRTEFVSLREMRVDHVTYWAEQPEIDAGLEQEVNRKWNDIELICRADSSGRLYEHAEALGKAKLLLADGKLLFAVPPLQPDQFKFYVSLASYGPPIDFEVRQAVAELHDLTREVGAVSVYVGTGFSRLLLKGVLTDLQQLGQLATTLSDWGFGFGLHTETFILDPTDVYEVDTIDSVLHAGVSPSVTRLMKVGRGRFDSIASGRPKEDVELVARAFNKMSRDLAEHPELEQIAMDLAEAALGDDPWKLTAALRYLQAVEGRFRELLIRSLLPATFGHDWFENRRRLAGDKEASVPDRPSQWTLKDCVLVADIAYKRDAQFAAALATAIGPEGLTLLQKLIPLRNVVAHGKLFETRSPQFPLATGPKPLVNLETAFEGIVLLAGLRRSVMGVQNGPSAAV